MSGTVVLSCPDCHEERDFERPGCLDGHGTDCLEAVCTVCGTAVETGALVVERPAAVPAPRRAARAA